MEFAALAIMSPYVRHVKRTVNPMISGRFVDFDYVFVLVDKGEADYTLEGVRYSLKSGDALLITPFTPHVVKATSLEPLCECIIHFDMVRRDESPLLKGTGTDTMPTDDELMAIRTENRRYLPEPYYIARLNLSEQAVVKTRFARMRQEHHAQNPGAELMLKSLCIEILTVLFRCGTLGGQHAGKKEKTWSIIEKAMRFVNDNYADEALDNLRLSQAVEISPNYLSSIFSQQLGISVRNYVNHIRLEKAKELMRDTNKNLSEIALDVGFSGIHVFSKVFKKMNGASPSHFLANQNNIH